MSSEKKYSKILKYLLSVSEDGRYVIVKVPDVLAAIKSVDTPEARKQVVGAVKSFIESEYIGCKYYDQENICLVPLPKGHQWEAEDGKARRKNPPVWVLMAVVFVCAFVGAFLGSWLAGMV